MRDKDFSAASLQKILTTYKQKNGMGPLVFLKTQLSIPLCFGGKNAGPDDVVGCQAVLQTGRLMSDLSEHKKKIIIIKNMQEYVGKGREREKKVDTPPTHTFLSKSRASRELKKIIYFF